MGEMKNTYKILVGKHEGERQLGRPKRRWEYNIRKNLMEIVLKAVDWIHLTEDRDQWRALVNTVMNIRVP
jgi:hypothetical protein